MKREQTLENFYVYDGNKVALLAVKKIIEFPGELFNPLYIYSTTGLGKTHLLLALHEELNKKSKTLYFSIKEFENYIEQTKIFDTPLIIDDLQSLDGRFGELLLGIIDSFVATNKQICFSGNVAPRELTKFDSRLWSRLEGGLVCDIAAPKEFALVELIKKKSEEQGILLPDEVALEIAQISTGSIRTIEGMINRLVAYSSLGNVQLDTANVRMILKDFYPKGIYSPVTSLLEELKKNASEVLQQVSETVDERGEYREKLYIWEMKGFDTSSLKSLIEGDINELRKKYDVFINKVEKLVELQKEYGSLDLSDHPDKAMQIESMLFSPDRVEEIDSIISGLRKIQPSETPGDPFAGIIVNEYNENALRIYREQIAVDIGSRFNPFVIYGPEGSGKGDFLKAIAKDMRARGKSTVILDMTVAGDLKRDCAQYDVVIIKHIDAGLKNTPEAKNEMFEFIADLIRSGKFVILSSIPLAGTDIPDEYKQLFEMGLEVELGKSSPKPEEPVVQDKTEPVADLVPLGLPGEPEKIEPEPPLEQKPEAEKIPEVKIEPEKVQKAASTGITVDIKAPLKKLREERLIIEEIRGEFVEENF